MVDNKKRDEDGETTDGQRPDREWAKFSKRLEKYLPDVMRRSASTAVRSFVQTEEGVRTIISAMLPRESINTVTDVLERAKSDITARFAKEFSDFLGRIDINKEIQRALTSLSIELRTEIRFIPNDKAILKPKVETKTRITKAGSPRSKTTRNDNDSEPTEE